MGVGAHAAGALSEVLGVARIAPLEDEFQAPEQGGTTAGVLDPAVLHFHFDAEVAFDTGQGVHHDGTGIRTLGSSFCLAHNDVSLMSDGKKGGTTTGGNRRAGRNDRRAGVAAAFNFRRKASYRPRNRVRCNRCRDVPRPRAS